MQFELGLDIFEPPESLPHILALLRSVQEGRHIWAPGETELAGAASYLHEHMPRLADAYLTLARKGLVDLQWTSTMQKPQIVLVEAASLGDLAMDLCRAAVLVVENLNSDGSFIKALSQIFDASRVVQALESGWLEIRHSGGSGNLLSVAQEEIGRFRRNVRVAVLFDSDSMVPGQRTHAHDVADHLHAVGAEVHVLALREIENYLPNRVLAAVRPIRVSSYRLRYVKLLTLDQRGFYDMKLGFGPASAAPRVPPDQMSLFGSLPADTLRGLRAGFGSGVGARLSEMIKSLSPRDYESLGASVVAEINEILVKIAQVI